MATQTSKKKAAKKTTERVHLALILDESGSMGHLRQVVPQQVNEFVQTLRDERDDDKEVLAWLSMFDTGRLGADGQPELVRFHFEGIALDDVYALSGENYRPGGGTPLNDAVMLSIRKVEEACKDGDRAMFVIVTDGQENSSQEFTASDVRERVQELERKDWTFVYLGANVDAWAEGSKIGVAAADSFGYTGSAGGTRSAMAMASSNAATYVNAGPVVARAERQATSDVTGGAVPEAGLTAAQKAEVEKLTNEVLKRGKK